MIGNSFTLYDLIKGDKIHGLIFDKFGQKDQFRLFPIDQNTLGAFEAYISASIVPRYSSKYLQGLELDMNDKKVLLYAFMNRETLGVSDGMSQMHNVQHNHPTLSPGSYEDNYSFDKQVLLELYQNITNLSEIKKQLSKALLDILSHSMTFCYFDKVLIEEGGSICTSCAKELRNEGYIIPDQFVKEIRKK